MSQTPRYRRLTAGQTLTVADLAYVASLEAKTRRLQELVDVDLADELDRERARSARHRRDAKRARKVADRIRAEQQQLLALLGTTKETTTPCPTAPTMSAPTTTSSSGRTAPPSHPLCPS